MRTSNTTFAGSSVRQYGRIIGVLALKDIGGAFKNKNILTIILVTLFMTFYFRYDTWLLAEDAPTLMVYDAGQSPLVAELELSPSVALYTYGSAAQMQALLAEGDMPELGLTLPADFDAQVAVGGPITLNGYVNHWLSDAEVQTLVTEIETELSFLTAVPVTIVIAERVYPGKAQGEASFPFAMSVIFTLVIVAIALVPHLLLAEKRAKTLDALLVSPASAGQIVLAKGLAGLFFAGTAVVIALYLNQNRILQWAVLWLAVTLGAVFVVALGLLVGSLAENQSQLALYAWGLVVPLLMPAFLVGLTGLLPEAWTAVSHWIPTVTLLRIIQQTCTLEAGWADYGGSLLWLAGWAVATLTAVAWIVNRREA